MYGYWICLERGCTGDLLERQHCIRSLREKHSKKKKWEFKKVGEQFTIRCGNGKIKLAKTGPSRHTTNPSRSYSNLVEDIN